MTDPVVQVNNLRVSYGDTLAVQDISLSIGAGEIFGILGPNGAGKTTTVECIAGLRQANSGSINVLGLDVKAGHQALRKMVGIQLQESGLPDKIEVAEALDLFASFYEDPRDPEELLTSLGLGDKRTTRFANLSGGQKQRLSIALALVGSPKVAILDELTTGLDPGARRETWKLISDIRDHGVTVILVTHFMEEAEYLCDRVAVFNHGRVIALDSPGGLAAGSGQRISFRPKTAFDPTVLKELAGVHSVSTDDGRIRVDGSGDLVATVIETLVTAGVVPLQTRVEQSTLDDAFVRMTADADAAQN